MGQHHRDDSGYLASIYGRFLLTSGGLSAASLLLLELVHLLLELFHLFFELVHPLVDLLL